MTQMRLITAPMRATALATALFAGLAFSLASPGSQAQGGPISAKKELVQKVLQLQQGAVEAVARGLAEQSIAPLAQQVSAVLQARIAPEQREAAARDIQAEFKKYGDEVLPLLRERAAKLAPSTVGAQLEEKLSEDELKQVIAMLEAPIFRKYQQLGPEMQKALLEKLVAETRPTVEPKLIALQEAVGKRLGLPPATPRAAASAAARSGASAPVKK